VIVLAELVETAEHERCLIYPVKFNYIYREEKTDAVIIEVDSVEELRLIAEGFQKPLLYDEKYFLVIFDKDVHYRTKKPEI
jgi:hypothetical protein